MFFASLAEGFACIVEFFRSSPCSKENGPGEETHEVARVGTGCPDVANHAAEPVEKSCVTENCSAGASETSVVLCRQDEDACVQDDLPCEYCVLPNAEPVSHSGRVLALAWAPGHVYESVLPPDRRACFAGGTLQHGHIDHLFPEEEDMFECDSSASCPYSHWRDQRGEISGLIDIPTEERVPCRICRDRQQSMAYASQLMLLICQVYANRIDVRQLQKESTQGMRYEADKRFAWGEELESRTGVLPMKGNTLQLAE